MTGVPPEVKLLGAEDLFERARACSRDASYINRKLATMESAEGVRGQSYEPTVSHTKQDVNGTARVVARMDYEGRMRERLDYDYAVIDYVSAVLYGTDCRSGLAALVGQQVADLLDHRYLGCMTWEAASEAVGMSPSTSYRKAEMALDLIDMYTPEVIMGGRGEAEDPD